LFVARDTFPAASKHSEDGSIREDLEILTRIELDGKRLVCSGVDLGRGEVLNVKVVVADKYQPGNQSQRRRDAQRLQRQLFTRCPWSA
jgi:hypothetical protein